MTERDIDQPRSRAEALRDVDYVIRLGAVHHRLFSRLEKTTRLIQLLGGSAAVGAVLGGIDWIVATVGIILALTAYADAAFEFGKTARTHDDLIKRVTSVTIKALDTPTMTAEQIDLASARATNMDLYVIEGLRTPCYNEAQRRHGLYSYVRPLSRWEQFIAAIA